MQHEEQVNGVRISPDHVNEVRQQFMDQVSSVVKEGEKVCLPKSSDTTALPKDTKSETSSKTPTVSNTSMSANVSKPSNDNSKLNKEAAKANNNGAKSSADSSRSSSDKSSTDSTKSSKPSQAKGKYQPDQNTSVKPGSYNGGKGTHWLNRTHSKFTSQKVY